MTIKAFALAGAAALSAITAATPTFARDYYSAPDSYRDCAQQKHENATAGTVMGALFGAIIGASVANHHDKGGAALIGAVAGGAIGNGVARSSTRCDVRYGYNSSGYGSAYQTGWNQDGYRQDYRQGSDPRGYNGRYDNSQNGRYDNGRHNDNGRGYYGY